MVILQLEKVDTGYLKGEPVLKDLTMGMNKGEFIGVVGPNGSGKSTLIKCITKVLEPWEGTLKLKGRDVMELSRKEIAKNVAVVPQDTYISFPFSVEEVVLMGRSPYLGRFENYDKEDEKITKRSLKTTKTYECRDRKINELSGGEMQRVIVARALAQDPDILLLDEATSHLDIGHKKEVMDTIKEKNEDEGLSVLSVHHNLNLAARYCNKILLLDDGEKHAFGRPEEVLTQANLRAVYGIEAEVHRHPKDGSLYISPVHKSIGTKEKGKTVHVVCGGGSSDGLFRKLIERGYEATAGVLNVMDSDHEKANFLDVLCVTEAPFSSISKEAYKKNLDLIRGSDAVVVTNFPVGEGNVMNLDAVDKGVGGDQKLILVKGKSIEKRDYTKDEKGVELYHKLLQKRHVEVVPFPESAVDILEEERTKDK